MSKVVWLEAVAAAWNDAGISYAVTHGIDEYPAAVGRDLDVLIARRDVARAMAAARGALEEHGLSVGRPPRVWGERLIAAAPGETPEMLEIHAITSLDWSGVRLGRAPVASYRVGPFAVDPWLAFAKRLLLPLLARSGRRLRDDPARLPLREGEREAAARVLPRFVGGPLTDALLGSLSRRDVSAALRLAPALRRALLVRGIARQPLTAVALAAHAVRRKIVQPFSPCAPVVAVAGGAASERAALVRDIAQGDLLVFTNCITRRWDDGGDAAAGVPVSSSFLRALHTTTVGDRYASMRQQLVLYDGCARSAAGDADLAAARFPWTLLPRPDVVLQLTSAASGGRPDAMRAAGTAARPTVVRIAPDVTAGERSRMALGAIAQGFVDRNRRGARTNGRA